MKPSELSTCFCTTEVDICRKFYQDYFSAEAIFDCGWYLNMHIGDNGRTIQFMQPRGDTPLYGGAGVTLNFKVDDVDAEYSRLVSAGIEPAMPLEDHPWGDRGFSLRDPIGTSIYIYSDRQPSDEFRQYYTYPPDF